MKGQNLHFINNYFSVIFLYAQTLIIQEMFVKIRVKSANYFGIWSKSFRNSILPKKTFLALRNYNC